MGAGWSPRFEDQPEPTPERSATDREAPLYSSEPPCRT